MLIFNTLIIEKNGYSNRFEKLKKINKNYNPDNFFLAKTRMGNFNIDKKDWFKIDIPHLLELDFLLIDGKLFPNISRSVLKVLFSNLTQ